MQCKEWHPVIRDETTRGARIRHAKEHDAATIMFDRLDLLELDAFLTDMYGSS
jgi:hypothetical protein